MKEKYVDRYRYIVLIVQDRVKKSSEVSGSTGPKIGIWYEIRNLKNETDLEKSNTSITKDILLNVNAFHRLDESSVTQGGESIGVVIDRPLARIGKGIGNAVTAKVFSTLRLRALGDTEDVPGVVCGWVDRSVDSSEHVAFDQDVAASCDVEVVALVVGEQVVDGVHDHISLASDLGSTAGDIVEVVVHQGNLVVFAEQEHRPVMVIVARRGPRGLAVKFGVGDCDTASRLVATFSLIKYSNPGGVGLTYPETII